MKGIEKMTTKIKYKSVSISSDNYAALVSIAAQLSDQLNMPVSVNSAVNILVARYLGADHE
jgi:Na+-driven multidrug efflux pump